MNRKASLLLLSLAATVGLRAGEAATPAWDNLEVSILHPALSAPDGAPAIPPLGSTGPTDRTHNSDLQPLWNATVAAGNLEWSGSCEDSAGLAGRTKDLRAEWAARDAVRSSQSNRDDAYHRVVDTVFPEPQIFRIGRNEIGGGVVNAIKRRNPFCLLTPVAFWWSF